MTNLLAFPKITEHDLQFSSFQFVLHHDLVFQIWDDGHVWASPNINNRVCLQADEMLQISQYLNSWLNKRLKWMDDHAEDDYIQM